MPRYIDTDYLDELITQLNHEGRGITRNEYRMIDNILFEFPTADVVEIRHGAWVESTESKFRPYMCSECGALFDVDTVMGELTWRFCPACGAVMEVK